MMEFYKKIKAIFWHKREIFSSQSFKRPARNPLRAWWLLLGLSILALPIVIGIFLWLIKQAQVVPSSNSGTSSRLLDEDKLRDISSLYDLKEKDFNDTRRRKPAFTDPAK